MIDRIEELLGSPAAEEDEEEEEWEDVPAQKRGAVANRRSVTTGETDTESAPVAGELWKDGPVWTLRGGSPETDEFQRAAMAGQTARAEEVPQAPRDGELIWNELERAARGGTSGLAPEGAERSGTARAGLEQTGLKGLYRQTVGGLRPAAPALPPEQAGKAVRAQEPGNAASLAVDELDRAVRRDSRRYDGGMSIY